MSQFEVEIRRHTPAQPWTYAMLDQRQREISARIEAGGRGALLLSELAPVITLGRRALESSLLFSRERFDVLGVQVYPADRGGFETYHGPGQWVLFPVEKVERLTGDPRGVREAVQALLEVALEVGREHEPSCEIREGAELGVWTKRGKVASVGVHVAGGVLLHGVSINGFRTPLSFQGLNPCGLKAQVDFLLDHPGQPVELKGKEEPFQALRDAILKTAQERFQRR